MKALPKKIAVLMGGPGSERDVSMATGKGVAKALRSLGAEVSEVDVKDADFVLPDGIELAFITVHGTFGEDGQLQQILEDRGVAYTGEGVAESDRAFDKIKSKEAFQKHNVATPYWQVITVGQRPAMPIPFVIKAPRQGSTVGVHIIRNEREVDAAIADASTYDRELLVEKFIAGRELTIGILGDQALPIIEIIPKGRVLRFHKQVSVFESERRRRRPACLPGKPSGRANARDPGAGLARASRPWPESLFTRRYPFAGGRRAQRS